MSFSVVLFPAPAATILTTAPPPGLDPRLTSLDCKKRVYNSLLYSGAGGLGTVSQMNRSGAVSQKCHILILLLMFCTVTLLQFSKMCLQISISFYNPLIFYILYF